MTTWWKSNSFYYVFSYFQEAEALPLVLLGLTYNNNVILTTTIFVRTGPSVCRLKLLLSFQDVLTVGKCPKAAALTLHHILNSLAHSPPYNHSSIIFVLYWKTLPKYFICSYRFIKVDNAGFSYNLNVALRECYAIDVRQLPSKPFGPCAKTCINYHCILSKI